MINRLLWIILMLSLGLMMVGCKKDNDSPEFGVEDIPAEGNTENGQQIFRIGDGGAVACSTCHSLEADDDRATGPSMAGIARRAGSREEGEDAREYLLNSIIAPGKHIVDGYSNTMPSSYAENLSHEQIADVIAFLLTLD
jgi:mono/diheme cytochrome c family protein